MSDSDLFDIGYFLNEEFEDYDVGENVFISSKSTPFSFLRPLTQA